MKTNFTGSKYQWILSVLKERIRFARQNAVISVNVQLLQLYWEIGQIIAMQEKEEGWGTKVVKTLSKDLLSEFPDMRGLSVRNLQYMRAFAIAYPEFSIVQAPLAQLPEGKKNRKENQILQVPLAKLTKNVKGRNKVPIAQVPLAQLSWYHHITLLDKVKSQNERLFYIAETVRRGWSRNVMVHQIESGLYQRQGKAITNFETTTAPQQSELLQQVFKDPYKFEFIYLSQEAKERDLEDALTNQITKFLLELGQWFGFMGKQYKIMVGTRDYSFDLLFYHTRLRRYIVIDLKVDEFKPEYAGKMNFYLTLADEQLRQEGDEASIGLILCKTKDGLVAEYALRDTSKPIGISEYAISSKLPKDIKGELPTIREIEMRMDEDMKELESPADKKFKKIKQLIAQLNKEELKERQTAKHCHQIFEQILIPLKRKLQKDMQQVTKEFETCEWYIHILNATFTKEEEARKELQLQKKVNYMSLEVQLKGFRKAGVKAFSLWNNEICFDLQDYYYAIGKDRHQQNQWMQKLYHQKPTAKELNEIADKFCENLYDSMQQQLERVVQLK